MYNIPLSVKTNYFGTHKPMCSKININGLKLFNNGKESLLIIVMNEFCQCIISVRITFYAGYVTTDRTVL